MPEIFTGDGQNKQFFAEDQDMGLDELPVADDDAEALPPLFVVKEAEKVMKKEKKSTMRKSAPIDELKVNWTEWAIDTAVKEGKKRQKKDAGANKKSKKP